MRTCAFLSADDLSGFVSDDELAVPPLAGRGWRVETASWRSSRDWSRFDAVVVRSTWDYQRAPSEFLRALEQIDGSSARLANALPVLRWNMSKTYLRDLAQEDVAIPRSIWADRLSADDVPRLFTELAAKEVVIKPVVSANADDTYRVARSDVALHADELERVFAHRPCIVQPFLPEIVEEGEYSVTLFNGVASHSILKTPKTGDFRVQEEHGGVIRRIEPTSALLAQAQRALASIDPVPLYARTDFVRTDAGFLLMELELIEPSLYLRMDASAPTKFADALVAWMAQVPA